MKPVKYTAQVKKRWDSEYKINLAKVISDSGKHIGEIKRYIKDASFRSTDIKRQAELVKEQFEKLRSDVTTSQKSLAAKFDFTAQNAVEKKLREQHILNTYENVISGQSRLYVTRYENTIRDLITEWNSIKAQAII